MPKPETCGHTFHTEDGQPDLVCTLTEGHHTLYARAEDVPEGFAYEPLHTAAEGNQWGDPAPPIVE